MASRMEHAALVAVRHYKRAQLFAWINDSERADDEFRRCLRAINYVKRRNYVHELHALEQHAIHAPRSRNHHVRAIPPEESSNILGYFVPLTHVLLLESSNRAEFRALVHVPPGKLASIAHSHTSDARARDIITDRMWQWVEVDQEIGFTGSFHLSFSDGTLYGQIVPHRFLEQGEAERLGIQVTRTVVAKLRI